jgi:hypothetical protein
MNISELRKSGLPLWMTNFGHESLADLVGGGSDIWSDRVHPEWLRDYGYEPQEYRKVGATPMNGGLLPYRPIDRMEVEHAVANSIEQT